MIIIDDHAHIEKDRILKSFTSMDDFISDQEKNNVKYIITQSLNRKTAEEALALSKEHKIILPALGIYPHPGLSQIEGIDSDFKWIKRNIGSAVAIGEVGLDYSYENISVKEKEFQRALFEKFIDLSIQKKLPIIIHSRKAEKDVIELLIEKNAKKVVLHCFSGKKKIIQLAYEHGFYFSVPTNIVKSQHFQMLVDLVDISKILTETDSPFMSPFTDGKPNQPKNIAESLKIIAKIKNMTVEETSNAIFQNFQKLYL